MRKSSPNNYPSTVMLTVCTVWNKMVWLPTKNIVKVESLAKSNLRSEIKGLRCNISVRDVNNQGGTWKLADLKLGKSFKAGSSRFGSLSATGPGSYQMMIKASSCFCCLSERCWWSREALSRILPFEIQHQSQIS